MSVFRQETPFWLLSNFHDLPFTQAGICYHKVFIYLFIDHQMIYQMIVLARPPPYWSARSIHKRLEKKNLLFHAQHSFIIQKHYTTKHSLLPQVTRLRTLRPWNKPKNMFVGQKAGFLLKKSFNVEIIINSFFFFFKSIYTW